MRTKTTRYRLFAALLSLCMMFAMFSGMPAFAVNEIEQPTPNITITIGGNPYPPAAGERVIYHENDPVIVSLEWKLDTGSEEDGSAYHFDGTTLTYDLGDIQIDPDNRNGVFRDGDTVVGNYYVDEDNILHVTLTDPEFINKQNRDVIITLQGVIPVDQTYDPEGEDHEVRIGTETITVTPEYDVSSVSLAKRVVGIGNVTRDENGYYVEFAIDLTVDGNVSDIVINDVLGDGLSVHGDPSDVFDFSFDFADIQGHDEEPSASYDGNGHITFKFNGQYHSGDRITIRYKAYVSEEKMRELAAGTGTVSNTASGTYTNNKGQQDQSIPEDNAEAGVVLPSLSKSGAWVDDDTIEWTITFQTGSMGDLRALSGSIDWSAFGLDKIIDALGDGLTLANGQKLDLANLTPADFIFISGPDANGNCVYNLTFRTTVDGDRLTYSNGVSSSFFEREFGDTAGVGPEGSISKTANSVNGDGTMSWTITVKLPEDPELLESFEIREMPRIPYGESPDQNQTADGEDYADIWTQQIVEGSIQIEGKTDLHEIGVTTSTKGGNLIIVFDVNNDFFRDNAGQTIMITLQTEIVDRTGSRVADAFAGNYRYTNTAQEFIDDTRVGSDTAAVEDKDENDIVDKYSAGTTNGTEALWYIQLTEDFVHGRGINLQGILAGGPFDLKLTDTLPEDMGYVDGSAYVEFYMGEPGNFSENEIPANLDELNAFLSGDDLLSVENRGETLMIHWNMTEELRQEILDFELWDANETAKTKVREGHPVSNDPGDEEPYYKQPWSHVKLRIYYKTQLAPGIDYDSFGEAGRTFINTVEGTVNGGPAGSGSADVVIQRSSALSKTYDYSTTRDAWNMDHNDPDYKNYYSKFDVSANGLYNIYYQVDVNPLRLAFGTSDQTSWITLEDTMGSNISLIPESVRVTDLDATPNRVLDDSEYDLTIDFNENSFKLSLPDSAHYRLEYFARIEELNENGEIENAWNKVELLGGWNESSSQDILTQVALRPAGYARSEDNFDIYKFYSIDDTGDTRMLSGATFQLTAYSRYDSETKKFIEITPEQKAADFSGVQWIQTSDPTISFESLHRNYIYRLEEVQAPDGFKKYNTVYYFIFSDYYANGTTDETVTPKETLLDLGVIVIDNGHIFRIQNVLDGNLLVTKTVNNGSTTEKFKFSVKLTNAEDELPACTSNFDAIQVIWDDGAWRALVDTVKVRTNEKGILLNVYGNPVLVNRDGVYYYVYVGSTPEEISDDIRYNHTVFDYATNDNSLTEQFPDGNLTVTAYLVPQEAYDEAESGSGWEYSDSAGYTAEANFVVGTIDMTSMLGHKITLVYSGSTTFVTKTIEFNAAGEATFELSDGEGLLFNIGDDVNYTIKEILTQEQLEKGWQFVEVDGTHTGGVTASGDGIYTVTGMTDNSKVTDYEYYYNTDPTSADTGSLTISKTVTGTAGDRSKEFHFTVALSDTGINGTYGDVTFVNGVASFTLKHGESKTICDLPEGVTYTVTETEANQDGYTTSVSGENGTITDGGNAHASFVNSKEDLPDKPDEPSTPSTPNEPSEPSVPDASDTPGNPPDEVPKTGDNSRPELWMALMLASAIGLIGVRFFSSTKRKLFSVNGRHISK